MGRPVVHDVTVIMTASIEAKLKTQFDQIAEREGKSRSELLEHLMEEYVKAHLNGNEQFTLETASGVDFMALPTMGEPLKETITDKDTLVEVIRKSKARNEEAASRLIKLNLMSKWDVRALQEGRKV